MGLEPCWLTNQTGAIIRFRTSQVPKLPNEDVDLTVELFDGRVVPGRFHLNPANPYVAGTRVRRFIRSRVPDRSWEQALISVTGRHWRLFEAGPVAAEAARYGVSRARAEQGRLTGRDLERMLKRIDAISGKSGRRAAYDRLLRPAGLRQVIIGLMGAQCQVEGCDAAQATADQWEDAAAALSVLEVHHIEAVAKVEDHTPKNLCVICANHHRLIHGFGPWAIHRKGDHVVLVRGERHLRILRDLSALA